MNTHAGVHGRLTRTAFVRDGCIREERRRRVVARQKRRLDAKKQHVSCHDDDDLRAKLRSVFGAVRAHTNSDVQLTIDMNPSELFASTLRALSAPTAARGAAESRFVGDAMELVSKLNGVLASF